MGMSRLTSLVILLFVTNAVVAEDTFTTDISPFLSKYCVECHSGDDPNGDINFALIDSDQKVVDAFETWAKVDELLASRKMPPEDEPQPTQAEVERFHNWYQHQIVDSIEAKPSVFRPRRLSATEYRNTIRSLFGFDLEVAIRDAEQTISEKSLVMKLLPTDPPGASRFRNDTNSNPLTTQTWEQYAYLVDFALEELFAPQRRERLEEIAGPIADDCFGQTNAVELVRQFAPRAWRRDLDEATMKKLLRGVEDESDSVVVAKRDVKAILMSPQFIFRGLMMERIADKQQAVDDFELAERLSYFIWADMPDEELFAAARTGKLREQETLKQQVERMLDSAKASNLATDFATQWLTLNEIEHVSDNPPYMVALMSQPIDFFNYLIAEDRPLLELVDSNVTFANTHTRRFYPGEAKQLSSYRRRKGIEVEIVSNQKIMLENTQGRGGILTMPGILAMNRGPILRGVWMLERIVGEHLADPPPDVGQVKANIPGEDLSFRERFAQHRENKSCAICHDKIDPLGFALEGYDNKGGFLLDQRYRKNKKRKDKVGDPDVSTIDTSGQLPSGEAFSNFDELKQILTTSQRKAILRNIVKQMLAYGLCRKLEAHDQPTVEQILARIEHEGTWRELVFEIANSLPFRATIVAGE